MLKLAFSFLLLTTVYPPVMRDLNPEEADKHIQSWDWKRPGTLELPLSHSILDLPSEHLALLGEEASKSEVFFGNTKNEFLEAIVYRETPDIEPIHFEYFPYGYISLDTLDHLDSDALLKDYQKDIAPINKARASLGESQIEIVGWAQKPHFDRLTHTLNFALEGLIENKYPFVNAIALKFSRDGLEKITWVTKKEVFVPSGGELTLMMRSHAFEKGHRYEDYQAGDKLAPYTINSILQTLLNSNPQGRANSSKLLKQWGIYAVAICAGLFMYLRSHLHKPVTTVPDPLA